MKPINLKQQLHYWDTDRPLAEKNIRLTGHALHRLLLPVVPLLVGLTFLAAVMTMLQPHLLLAQADVCFVSVNNSSITDYSSADAAAVQAAVDAASPDDLLKIAGTCAGVNATNGITQTVYISKSLTLRGGYTPSDWSQSPDPETFLTTLDAVRNGRVVALADNITVTLDSLTITGGDYRGLGGGIYNHSSTLTITNTRVISNIVRVEIEGEDDGGRGGGLGNETGTITIYNSEFEDNWAQQHGGAIKHFDGQLSIDNSEFTLNTVQNGDGGALDTGDSESTVVTITNSIFTNNKVGDDGGAIWIGNDASLTVSDSTFSNNEATDKGGAIICTGRCALRIDDSMIANNVAQNSGGGLYASWSTHVYASNSTISGNQVLTSTETLENGGGAFKITNSGALTLTHMTIVSNTAPNLSGKDGILVLNGSLTISNSLIAYNGTANCRVESGGTMTSGGYNLGSDATCTTLTATGDITNTDPLLGPLADNGGDTLTHALRLGSPAIDMGDPAYPEQADDYDQRGVGYPRVKNGRLDIGAFEFGLTLIYLPIVAK
jgi:predicted outer membrane repeat protein